MPVELDAGSGSGLGLGSVPESGSGSGSSEPGSNLKLLKEEILRQCTGDRAFSAEELVTFNNLCDGGMHPREARKEAQLTTWVRINEECRVRDQEWVDIKNACRPRKKVS